MAILENLRFALDTPLRQNEDFPGFGFWRFKLESRVNPPLAVNTLRIFDPTVSVGSKISIKKNPPKSPAGLILTKQRFKR